ncbi:MAG: thymidine phosphorylase [Myxococcales bacterium]|nr:thymidine phosphorylase [Myxococcales bacterium]
MRAQDLIRTKRDGRELSESEIRAFIAGVTDGSVPDYQASALLMAVFFKGLSEGELSVWADAMTNSGRVLDLARVPGAKIDKHSTGGVGDKVSLCLAPLVAACGVPVPMISGRGLGHTGGTLDKLEAIPGFSTALSVDRFIEVVSEAGLSLIGQTDDLAPADRKLYALRDVTSTVESIPLIASSIMSKKLAEGIDGLVLDVKVGSGAFMKELGRARELARTLLGIGQRAGKRVTAFITDMNQPLGREIGNANETREAIDVLKGEGPDDLVDITLQLGAEMLLLGGVCQEQDEALQRMRAARKDGSGLAALAKCVEMQGGDPAAVHDTSKLPQAKWSRPVLTDRDAVLTSVDTERVGIAAMVLGAGRETVDDVIDHSVGVTMNVRLGDRVKRGDTLATLWYNDEERSQRSEQMLRGALEWSDQEVPPPPLVYEVLR